MSDNPVRDIPHYLRVFQTHLGSRVYLIFLLTFAATLSETFGLVLVLPLLQNLGVAGSGKESVPINAMLRMLDHWGLLQSTVALLAIIGVAYLAKGLLMSAAFAVNAYLRAELLRTLKLRLFDDYSQMSRGYYSGRDSGHFINVINDQITRMLLAFNYLAMAGSFSLTSMAYLGLIFIVAWRFGVMALAFGGIVLLLFHGLNMTVRRLSRQAASENGKLTQLLIIVQALSYIRATDQVSPFRDNIRKSVVRLTGHEMRHGIADGYIRAAREPIVLGLLILIVSFQLYVLEQPVATIMVAILASQRALSAVLAMQHYWLLALTYIGGVELVHNEFEMQAHHRDVGGTQPVGDLVHGIDLRNIDFSWDPSQGVTLSNVSLRIPARHSVALVGPSGAGKSTIVDLITLEVKPMRGQILIEGVPSEQVQLSSWRRRIGYVPQSPPVFDDSIANNICMWTGDPLRDQALQERIRIAARKAQIDRFVEGLPDGYQTQVGDRGIRLSGGQRQRLCIARELFREPQLLILDEATSALDSESEQLIQQSIRDLHGRISLLIIAHRLSTIRGVDEIYVIESGRVVEHGSHRDLLESRGSRFRELVARQS